MVWDRRRFQVFWGWEYKLEAYVPAHKRRMRHYAMPVLWREHILGWANLKVVDGRLRHELGFAGAGPRDSAFHLALDEALHQMQEFRRGGAANLDVGYIDRKRPLGRPYALFGASASRVLQTWG